MHVAGSPDAGGTPGTILKLLGIPDFQFSSYKFIIISKFSSHKLIRGEYGGSPSTNR
jgi:hypothetical protein